MMHEGSTDTMVVDAWMREFARAPLPDSSRPSPAVLWWKAQLQRRWDADHRELRRVERVENVLITLTGTAALSLAAWAWTVAPASHPFLVITAIAIATTLAIVAPGGFTSR